MRKYGYLVVEGPHDVEFAYRLLNPFGLTRLQYKHEVDSCLSRLIPKDYPPPDGDLQKRMPTPLFMQSNTHAIAIHSAMGDSKLVSMIEETIDDLDREGIYLSYIGILLDSDEEVSASKRYNKLKQSLASLPGKNLALPESPGDVISGPPKLGAFVLPDNGSPGTLEDLLLDSAKAIYPCLLASALHYVDTASQDTGLVRDEVKAVTKNSAGRNKAIIGAMANIMRPGKAIQTSIQDNRWLRGAALTLPRIRAVQDFLRALFELP